MKNCELWIMNKCQPGYGLFYVFLQSETGFFFCFQYDVFMATGAAAASVQACAAPE